MKKRLGPKTLIVPTPVLLVGTYDARGAPNLATVAWGGIVCSEPVCISVSLRSATYSHGSILASRAFTASVATAEAIAKADYAGIASGRDEDKFARLGWTPVRSERVAAPYPAELPLVLECTLREHIELGLHTLFIGQVQDVLLEESLLLQDGRLDVQALGPAVYAPVSREYFALGASLGRAFHLGRKVAAPGTPARETDRRPT